jgi:transposase InsO family protein
MERPDEEVRLVAEMRALAALHPRYGYRRIRRLLVRDGWKVSRSRIQRLWRREGLRVPQRRRKRRRLGNSGNSCIRRVAEYRNHVWAYDFVSDRTEDGRRVKILAIVDEYTRECLCLHVSRHITSQDVIEQLAILIQERGAPKFVRSDNGPEFIAIALREWLATVGTHTLFIEPGSPWQNAYIESFNGKLADELLDIEVFTTLAEAKYLAKQFRHDYNHHRPHSSLDELTPAEFAAALGPSGSATLRLQAQGPGAHLPQLTT